MSLMLKFIAFEMSIAYTPMWSKARAGGRERIHAVKGHSKVSNYGI